MEGLDILDYTGDGYQPVHDFASWRVAYLNCQESNTAEGMRYIERHNETDEIFVLLNGEATLLIGEERAPVVMEKFKTYNVKQGVWHNVIVSRDVKILIVENSNTSEENSDYLYFR
ncbi:MAG: cupin [Oscillospiraceae bacterium]|nr:cupin [Oscillospiraceae bacterium]